jgi:hypothetical protein
MYKRMLILCCAFLVAITQSGCIGLIINTPGECKNETPFTRVHDIFWGTPPQFKLSLSSDHVASKVQTQKRSSKEEFLKDWGKPDEIISISENVETWIYKRKLWCGAIPILILPIPFILPVCDGFDRIEFRGNEAMRLHTRSIVYSGIGPTGPWWKDPECRFPLSPNNGVDSDAAKPAAQVTP